jgi:hypothetical protein
VYHCAMSASQAWLYEQTSRSRLLVQSFVRRRIDEYWASMDYGSGLVVIILSMATSTVRD